MMCGCGDNFWLELEAMDGGCAQCTERFGNDATTKANQKCAGATVRPYRWPAKPRDGEQDDELNPLLDQWHNSHLAVHANCSLCLAHGAERE